MKMMKNYINKILLTTVVCAVAFGCKKYEQFPVDKVTANYVFDPLDSAGVTAQQFLYGVYAVVKNGHNRVGGDYLDAAADDAVSSSVGTRPPVTLISTNAISALSFPGQENVWEGTGSTGTPDSYFGGIRTANIFINGIGVVPVKAATSNPPGVSTSTVWKSEARVLRAYFYYELIKRYGGVPLLGDKVYNISDNVQLPRSSFADCVQYIVNECDAVKNTLISAPVLGADNYRITKGAAMALKARVLLLAASPLFNGGNIGGSNPLTGYPSFDANRWALAATAAQDVISLNKYSLDPSFKDIFLTQLNSEIIMIRPGGNNQNIETANGPVGFSSGGTGNTSPTQELVNAFPMQNGLAITDPASGYSTTDPYGIISTKRDPRLAATVLYNGAMWLNTNLQTYEGGLNKPNSSLQQTLTSYYMRKFMGLFEATNNYSTHASDWVVMRYAEILLGFAEARNEVETTPQADVYAQLYAIRARAGIDAGINNNYGIAPNMTQAQMRAFIQNEWRIEFAFEEHRFFDIRRWKIAQTVMNQPRTGLSIVFISPNLTFNPKNVLTTTFTTNDYLYPVPYNEVAKNPSVTQNPGW